MAFLNPAAVMEPQVKIANFEKNVEGEIEILNKEVDERNLALYEIRQQTLRQTNKETIFTKQTDTTRSQISLYARA